MNINFELVYHARKLNDAVLLRRRDKLKAETAFHEAEESYRKGVAKLANISLESLDFSNTLCLASGVYSHIYHIVKSRGTGNKCIFCGCDDFDF
jgi:hypothetical protein